MPNPVILWESDYSEACLERCWATRLPEDAYKWLWHLAPELPAGVTALIIGSEWWRPAGAQWERTQGQNKKALRFWIIQVERTRAAEAPPPPFMPVELARLWKPSVRVRAPVLEAAS